MVGISTFTPILTILVEHIDQIVFIYIAQTTKCMIKLHAHRFTTEHHSAVDDYYSYSEQIILSYRQNDESLNTVFLRVCNVILKGCTVKKVMH